MTSNWARAGLVFLLGMLACSMLAQLALLFYPYFADQATHRSNSSATLAAGIIVSASSFALFMRLGTKSGRQDQDGRRAAWFLPAMFVLGAALCTAVGWVAFLWANEIAQFIHLTLRA